MYLRRKYNSQIMEMVRMIKRSYFVFSVLFFTLLFSGCSGKIHQNEDYVYQVSTIDTLKSGGFEGSTTVATIVRHGDQGLGTFDSLDGEMVIYEGVVYKAGYNGELIIQDKSVTTPFAVVTNFNTDYKMDITDRSCNEIKSEILDSFDNKSLIRAIHLNGEFEYIRYRSVKKQTKPYPALDEVVKNQHVMKKENIIGDSVGFWFPDDYRGVNAEGFHLHFINEDETTGGHVLDCKINRGVVYIDNKDKLIISIK